MPEQTEILAAETAPEQPNPATETAAAEAPAVVVEPAPVADPVIAAARERIRLVNTAPQYAKKEEAARATRRLPAANSGTRYFMAKPLPDGLGGMLGMEEEVTCLAAGWHKAGTLLNLLQRQYVVAVPECDLTSAGYPPAVPEPLMPLPTLDAIVGDLVASTGKSRAAVLSVATKIHAVEHDAYVRRLEPYGTNSREAWKVKHGGTLAALEKAVVVLVHGKPADVEPPPAPAAVPKAVAYEARRIADGQDPSPRDWRSLPAPTADTQWWALRKIQQEGKVVAGANEPRLIPAALVDGWRKAGTLVPLCKRGSVLPWPLANPYLPPVAPAPVVEQEPAQAPAEPPALPPADAQPEQPASEEPAAEGETTKPGRKRGKRSSSAE